jgi:hypothetical protein
MLFTFVGKAAQIVGRLESFENVVITGRVQAPSPGWSNIYTPTLVPSPCFNCASMGRSKHPIPQHFRGQHDANDAAGKGTMLQVASIPRAETYGDSSGDTPASTGAGRSSQAE